MFLSFHTFANCMLDCLHLNQKKNYWYAFNWVYLLEFIAAELNRILWLSLIWCRALNAWVTRAPRRLNWSLNMRLLQISSSRDRLVVRTLRCGRSNRSSNLRHGIRCLKHGNGMRQQFFFQVIHYENVHFKAYLKLLTTFSQFKYVKVDFSARMKWNTYRNASLCKSSYFIWRKIDMKISCISTKQLD